MLIFGMKCSCLEITLYVRCEKIVITSSETRSNKWSITLRKQFVVTRLHFEKTLAWVSLVLRISFKINNQFTDLLLVIFTVLIPLTAKIMYN